MGPLAQSLNKQREAIPMKRNQLALTLAGLLFAPAEDDIVGREDHYCEIGAPRLFLQ